MSLFLRDLPCLQAQWGQLYASYTFHSWLNLVGTLIKADQLHFLSWGLASEALKHRHWLRAVGLKGPTGLMTKATVLGHP